MKNLFMTIIAVASVLRAVPPSDTCKQETWITNGTVNAIVAAGDKVYIGGSFTQVGPYTGDGVPIDASGAAVSVFPKIQGTVNAVCSDGNGGWFVGGAFSSVDNVGRNNIAHILSNGSLDPAWNPNAYNTVYSLAVNGSTVYVGGDFTNIGGQNRNRIAALDATTGNATAWDPNADSVVYSLAVSGATVYAGGRFATIGGQGRNRIAALDATTGLAADWNPNANSVINALAVSGATVYAGGDFTGIGDSSRNRIAALDSITGKATAWNPNADGVINALAVSGATVHAGGDFTGIGDSSRNRIAALDSTTGKATAWNPNANKSVRYLAVSGTTVYAGGDFTGIGGQSRNYIAALDATTGNASVWNPNTNNSVRCLAVSGTTVYAGGWFTSIGSQGRNYIAALDATTGNALAWNPNANDYVYSLAANGTTVYAGGFFTGIGGEVRNHIAALDATTGNATAWNPNADSVVYSLAASGTTVYAGGRFFGIGDSSRNRIAALDATTGKATAWNPKADSAVFSLAMSGATVYAGGRFAVIGGQARNRLAALDATTGNALAWNPNADSLVYSLALSGTTVYAGGRFLNIGDQSRNHIAALNQTTGNIAGWNPNANDLVRCLAVSGTTVYAGGQFTSIGGQSRNYIAAMDMTTGNISAWNPNAKDYVLALAVSGATVYVGGQFRGIGQGVGHSFFAQFGNYYLAPVVSSISPSSGVNNAAVHITNLGGFNFRSGATVKLVKAGQSDINATNVSVISATQITCTVDITNAAPGAWDVVVANEDSKSATLSQGFTIVSGPPVLVSPANNATDISLTPTLTWHKAANDSLYTVQISASSGFSSLLVNDNHVSDTSLSLTSALPANNTAYYWKVAITQKGGGITDYSAPWTFTTVVAAPGAPVLLLPVNTAQNQAVSPTLSWNSAATAASYRLQVSVDPSFSTTVCDAGTSDTIRSLIGLANNTLYYWHVAAVNAGGVTWSALWSFTTIVAIPGAPNCLFPSADAENVAVNTPLIWSKITGAISYRTQIATDTGFTSIVKDSAGISDTSFTWAGYLNDTHYYWRVNSTNAGGSSQWSGRSNFTTIISLPSAVTLLTPRANDTVKIDSAFLAWSAGTPKVDRYWVEYAPDSLFNNYPAIDTSVIDTIKLVRNLTSKNNSVLWWRVKAHNAAGWGDWSAKRVFEVNIQLTHIRLMETPKAFSFAISGRTGSIRYALPKPEHVLLRLYSVNGQLQSELVNKYQNAGYFSVNMQSGVHATGSYLVVFKAGNYHQKRLISLMQ